MPVVSGDAPGVLIAAPLDGAAVGVPVGAASGDGVAAVPVVSADVPGVLVAALLSGAAVGVPVGAASGAGSAAVLVGVDVVVEVVSVAVDASAPLVLLDAGALGSAVLEVAAALESAAGLESVDAPVELESAPVELESVGSDATANADKVRGCATVVECADEPLAPDAAVSVAGEVVSGAVVAGDA